VNLKSALSICFVFASCLSADQALAGPEGPVDSPWQVKRLLNPNERQVALEQSGKVFIYYGLTDRTVDRAMSANFDRIEHMMFARTIKTDSQGEPLRNRRTGKLIAEEDGC
jgi:hypothetical protein